MLEDNIVDGTTDDTNCRAGISSVEETEDETGGLVAETDEIVDRELDEACRVENCRGLAGEETGEIRVDDEIEHRSIELSELSSSDQAECITETFVKPLSVPSVSSKQSGRKFV